MIVKYITTTASVALVEALKAHIDEQHTEADLPAGALNYDMRAVSNAVGLRAALDIMLALGGSTLYVPRPEELLRWLRDQRICSEYDAGGRVKDICYRYRLSERTVYKVLKGPREGAADAIVENPVNDLVESPADGLKK